MGKEKIIKTPYQQRKEELDMKVYEERQRLLQVDGAIGIALIEIKSIYEKAEDKVRIDNVTALAGQVIANRDNLDAIAHAVADYMAKKEGE